MTDASPERPFLLSSPSAQQRQALDKLRQQIRHI